MFDRNLMRLEGMRAIMGALVVLALLQAATISGQAFALSRGISMLWEGMPLSDALPFIVAFLGCFLLLQIIRFGQETMLDAFSRKRAASLRSRILAASFNPRTMLAARRGAAAVVTTATDGIDEIQTYIRIIPPKVVGMAAISIPLLIITLMLDWVSAVILLVMFPVIIFFMILLGRQASARAERQYASYTRLTNRFVDTLRGLSVIRAFKASKAEATSTFEHSEHLRTATVRTLTTATLSSAVLDLCATFGVAAVAMMLAFRLMDGSILLSTALFALILAPEYFQPIRAFASDFHASLDGKNALAAALEMLPTDDICDSESQTGRIAWTDSSTLTLEDLSYSYDGKALALDSASFEVRGFRKIALVGPSGSGKSTLVNILAGFTSPSAGHIAIDGKPADLADPSWKGSVRYLPQNPYVFHATLRENLCFYSGPTTQEALEEAVAAVGLDDLVSSLPEGLDTVIGEGARGLSGGQAHRIALARMLLDDAASVLVFDEPTAHLDIETELELKERMLALMEGKLVFFATHRLHWVKDTDLVIRLDNGHITSVEEVAR